MEESLRNHPYSHVGHQDEFKDDMFSDAIEGEPSHLEEITPTFSPSIPTLDVSFELIFQPILGSDESSYALSCKSYDDHRNPLRQPNHGNHEDYKCDKKEQQKWLKDIKNLFTIAIEWMDEALDETNPRDQSMGNVGQ
jgi:hypothetical protein